jgi:hypothetical protein
MDTPEADRLVRIFDQLTGEAHALFIFCQVIGNLHSDPKVLLSELTKAEQSGLAHIEAAPLRDTTVVAFQATIAGLRRAILANPRHSDIPPDQALGTPSIP